MSPTNTKRCNFRNLFKKLLFSIIKNSEIHFLFSCLIIFATLYITICALFGQNIVHPFSIKASENNVTETSNDNDNILISNGDYVLTIMALFVLWVAALIFGRIAFYIKLPPLLGMLIVGILFRNVYFLSELLKIEKSWEVVLRSTSFILILIRCGMGLNPDILQTTLHICGTIGIFSPTLEVLAIVLTAHFIFGFPVFVAIVFGYLLASTSPAVTVPTMIQLQEKGLGTYKGIPTIILASASIDNLYCITAFYFMADMVFMEHDLYTFVSIPIELVFAILIGILIGLLLRVLPRSDSQKTSLHFIRGSLILSISLALYFGSKSIKCDIAGPVSILCMCAVASMSWKRDNSKKTMPEEKCLRILWVLVFQPFLFALIGLVFDISKIELNRIVIAIEILVIGVLFRIIVVFILSFVGKFNFKERCYISIAFLPKATVQAALVPIIYNYCSNDYTCRPFAQDILQTCILSIIITAPVGQILLQVLSRCLLNRDLEGSLATVKINDYDNSLFHKYIPKYPSSYYISADDFDDNVFVDRF